MRGGSGSGSSSTGLKRSAYPWAVLTERDRAGRVAAEPVSLCYASVGVLSQTPTYVILPSRPFSLHVEQDLAAAIVVAQFGLEEGRQILHHVDLGLLDVLHPPENVLACFFVFCLLCTQLLLHAEILLLCLLHLGERGVVGEAAGLKLLAGSLGDGQPGHKVDCRAGKRPYLVLFHLHKGAIQALKPGCGGAGNIRFLHTSQSLVCAAECWGRLALCRTGWLGGRTGEAIAELRVRLKVLAVGDHGRAEMATWELLLAVVAFSTLGERLDVDGHGFLHAVHAWQSGQHGVCGEPTEGSVPSWRKFISNSNDLNSSDRPVRASAPIFSLVHCFKRSNFLLMFMATGAGVGSGRLGRGGRDI